MSIIVTASGHVHLFTSLLDIAKWLEINRLCYSLWNRWNLNLPDFSSGNGECSYSYWFGHCETATAGTIMGLATVRYTIISILKDISRQCTITNVHNLYFNTWGFVCIVVLFLLLVWFFLGGWGPYGFHCLCSKQFRITLNLKYCLCVRAKKKRAIYSICLGQLCNPLMM